MERLLRVFRAHRESLQICGLFGGIIAAFFLITSIKPVYEVTVAPFTAAVAWVSTQLLEIGFDDVARQGTMIRIPGSMPLDIKDECNGIYATFIFLAATLAYPARLVPKLIGLVGGFFAIFLVNQVRVVSLFVIAKKWPSLMEDFHIFVWQTVVVVFAVLLWLFWADRIAGRRPAPATPDGK
jgi:exosortase/archaeosortase family protein